MSSSKRKSLLNSFRIAFIVNVFVFFSFCFACFYYRSRVRSLESSVTRLLSDNAKLAIEVERSIFSMTNTFVSAAASFVSNRLLRASSGLSSFPFSTSSNSVPPSSDVKLPPFDFYGYCEIDNVPFIRLGRKWYKKGDIILGYPIEDITPDVVQYRENFFKVVERVEK